MADSSRSRRKPSRRIDGEVRYEGALAAFIRGGVSARGLVAAAGTRRSVIESLNRALNDALSSDEVRQRLALAGADPEPGTPRNYTVLIDHELTLWSDLVKAAGIRPE